MKFTLAYGKTGHTIELPDHYRVDKVEPRWIDPVPDQNLAILNALRDPYKCLPLASLVSSNSKIAIIFSDITRATPYHVILPALLSELKHIPRENITFFCSNGTHRFAGHDELIKILGSTIVKNYRIVQNDSTRIELHDYAGTTSSGNKIYLNKEILGYEIKILTGFIEPHFFAGFSGGGKALVPGLAYLETIKYNHSIAKLSIENVTWGKTDGNPLWEEIMEAAEFVPGLFLLNITLNRNKEITNVFAGDMRTAHKAGCQFVMESAMAPVNKLYDIVITSNSGYPLDLNVYQTVKGMSAAAQIVKQGGSIIIAAECWDGIPSNSDYERILGSVDNVDGLIGFITKNESKLKDTWQIFCQAVIQQKADVYLYSDKLDNTTIRKTLLNPTDDISGLTTEIVRKIGPGASICVLPEGPLTIPYLE
jgi:lactate racemase